MDVNRKKVTLLAAITLLLQMSSVLAQEAPRQLSLFGLPPSLGKSADPNLIVTFDNSQSMYRGYLPDSVGPAHGLKAAKSSRFNEIYYDPEKTYLPPIDENGDRMPAANFNAALTNPFNGARIDSQNPSAALSGDDGSRMRLDPVHHTVDLGSEYAIRWDVSDESGDIPSPAITLPLTVTESRLPVSDRGKAFYYVFKPILAGCDANDPADDDCYEAVVVSDASGPYRNRLEISDDRDLNKTRDERQNFANWYQYYSLRVLAAKTVSSQLINSYNIVGGLRIARQTLTEQGPRSGSSLSSIPRVQPFSSDSVNFIKWLFSINMGGDTPLRSATTVAGEFLKDSNEPNVYREEPWNSLNPGTSLSCRANFHLIISDGVWSDEGNASFAGNDAVSATLPDHEAYPATSQLYRLDQQQTMADIAFNYWSKDLAEGLRNNVPQSFRRGSSGDVGSYWDYLNDPAEWQHLTQIMLSFGSTSRVPATSESLDAMLGGNTFVDNNGQSQSGWPAVDAASQSDAGKVDDLYHAAINSRGAFYNLLNSDGLVQAITSHLSSDASDLTSYLPLATNAGSIGSNTLVFRAEYNGRNRTGDVKAFNVATGQTDSPCAGDAGTLCNAAVWRVNTGGYHGAPNVYTYDADRAGDRKGIPFMGSQVSASVRDLLRMPGETDEQVNQRIAYLAGSDVAEQQRGGRFRNRTPEQRTLGLIVNSTLAYAGNGFNANGSREMGYPDDIEAESYGTFLEHISGRTPMVYVGSSDGKLHAINATNGTPAFDYIPGALLPRLKSASRPDYAEDVMVDGQISTGDVFFNGEWHTVLIGGLRTGGKAYYALDITDPAAVSASTKVLWELTPTSAGAEALGYTYSRPLIVKSNATDHDGTKWVAIFGNGYNSVNSEAVLFIVDIGTGEVLRTISTRSALTPAPGQDFIPNGLNTPAAVFADSNFTADYVYAGDLRGNLWKFDLSSSNPNDWKVAYGTATGTPTSAAYDPKPLFVAKDAQGKLQPITAAPVVGGHPQGRDGLMVYFGTGKFIENADSLSIDRQSFYAIWDRDLCASGAGDVACITVPGSSAKSHRAFSIDRGQLLQQNVTTQTDERREVSSNNIDWAQHSGWYLDFPARGDDPAERVIAQASLRSGMVVFPTFIPGSDACEGVGSGWLMALSRVNGGVLDHEPFTSNHGDVENNDYAEAPSAGRSIDTELLETTVLGCGGNSCIVSEENGDMEILDEGMQWGRWRWKELQ